MNRIWIFLAGMVLAGAMVSGCGKAHGNYPGKEYMPDMGVSIAYEANKYVHYTRNTWDDKSVKTRHELALHNKPVKNTRPRGWIGGPQMMKVILGRDKINSVPTPPNSFVPFYYGDTPEERDRAIAEITENPFPITEKGLAEGKKLFNLYCAICHGKKADGNGYLARDDSPYPAAPANLMQDRFIDQTNGFYYYAIMKGRNKMGSYKDKLSYEERWQVIHYIRSLQAKKRGVPYTRDFYLPKKGKKK